MTRSPVLLRPLSIVGALALTAALALPTAANAATGDDALVFSHEDVVDRTPGVDGGEYEWISEAIANAGYVVTSFDGGDGEASTWSAALEGIEVFVLPEQEMGPFYDPASPPSWLSAEAFDVLVQWIRDGGTLLLSGTCEDAGMAASAHLLSAAVGVAYDADNFDCLAPESSTRWIDDETLPDLLGYADGTYPIVLSSLSEAQRAPLSVWYSGTADSCWGEQLTVGEFAAGSGRVVFEAWDYFNDFGAPQADWNAVLGSLLDGNASPSTWTASAPPAPTELSPITAVTASGQALYTINEQYCEDGTSLVYRVDPATALAAPVGEHTVEGYVYQGATHPRTGIAYVPAYLDDAPYYGASVLATVDLATGVFAPVSVFTSEFEDFYPYSLAIGADGSAYVFSAVDHEDGWRMGLFALDLADASLDFIAFVDEYGLGAPNGFAFNPANGRFYAFEEETFELFEVNVATGALTSLGVLDAPSREEDLSDVTALQIAADGTFYVVYDDVYSEEADDWGGMLATFTLADITGGVIAATEIGVLTDDVMETYSLLLSAPRLPDTGADGATAAGSALLAGVLLLLGAGLIAVRRGRRTA